MPYKPLSDAEVALEIRQLASANKIRWSQHVEERMAERGFDKGQVKECLRKGVFTERPTIANRPGEIQYVFRMEACIESESIAVAASLYPATKLVVITVF